MQDLYTSNVRPLFTHAVTVRLVERQRRGVCRTNAGRSLIVIFEALCSVQFAEFEAAPLDGVWQASPPVAHRVETRAPNSPKPRLETNVSDACFVAPCSRVAVLPHGGHGGGPRLCLRRGDAKGGGEVPNANLDGGGSQEGRHGAHQGLLLSAPDGQLFFFFPSIQFACPSPNLDRSRDAQASALVLWPTKKLDAAKATLAARAGPAPRGGQASFEMGAPNVWHEPPSDKYNARRAAGERVVIKGARTKYVQRMASAEGRLFWHAGMVRRAALMQVRSSTQAATHPPRSAQSPAPITDQSSQLVLTLQIWSASVNAEACVVCGSSRVVVAVGMPPEANVDAAVAFVAVILGLLPPFLPLLPCAAVDRDRGANASGYRTRSTNSASSRQTSVTGTTVNWTISANWTTIKNHGWGAAS